MPHMIIYRHPWKTLALTAEGEALTGLYFDAPPAPRDRYEEQETPLLAEAKRQLEAYFAGKLREFELPLAPPGTEFQRACWQALLRIPYGETRSYGEIAAQIGRPKASRAVGQANHVNPIAIIIPCHRVIGTNGKLVGYGGGLELKQKLLALEGSRLSA